MRQKKPFNATSDVSSRHWTCLDCRGEVPQALLADSVPVRVRVRYFGMRENLDLGELTHENPVESND